MHANEPVSRERLIDELWGAAAPRTVSSVLNVYISKLRRLLAGEAGEQAVLTHAGGYMLSARPESVDARRFESLLARGRTELACDEPERASETLADALGLWRGRPLADLASEPFAQAEIRRLEELRLTAVETRAEADLALGRQDSLVAELEALVTAHPYRERLRAQLMLALYRSGRQAEALETYRHARRAFSEELGIEPGTRLQELEGAILRHDPALGAPGPQKPQARDAVSDEPARRRPRGRTRRAVILAAALTLAVVAALVAIVRPSSGSPEPFVLTGDSVAVVDPGTNAIVDEVPVGGRPTGPAVGEGSVWVGDRDHETLLQIDPRARRVVQTIGLGVTPAVVAVGAGSVWVLSGDLLLRVDPATGDVVKRVSLPGSPGNRWSRVVAAGNTVWVWGPSALARIDASTYSISVRRRPVVGAIAYGEGALWAVAGYEADTIVRIDPGTQAVLERIPIPRIGAIHGYHYRLAAGDGALWIGATQALWRIDPAIERVTGSVSLGRDEPGTLSEAPSIAVGDGVVWVASYDGSVLRVDPESLTLTKAIPLGTLLYPTGAGGAIAVAEGMVWVAVISFAS